MADSRARWLTDKIRGKVILDIGFVGKAEDGLVLHRSFYAENRQSLIVGLDINRELLLKLREHNSLVGDAFSLPFKNASFDTVVLGEVIEHFFEISQILYEVSRVLIPRGKLYLTTPNPYQPFRWLRYWFLPRSQNLAKISNVKGFLGDPSHKTFWEPLSLVYLLSCFHLRTISVENKVFALPYLPAVKKISLPWWPFTRLGDNTCLIAIKGK